MEKRENVGIFKITKNESITAKILMTLNVNIKYSNGREYINDEIL